MCRRKCRSEEAQEQRDIAAANADEARANVGLAEIALCSNEAFRSD